MVTPLLFLIVSIAGFLDALYLTFKHFEGLSPVCSLQGCEVVTTSSYALVGPVPVALLGVIYYFVIFSLILFYLKTKKEKILLFASVLTVVGFLSSVWFVYLQLFVINAICIYCMLSAGTSTILFILGLYVLMLKKKENFFYE